MKSISIKEFARIIEEDDALRAQVRACADTDQAAETFRRLAAERGYALEETAPAGPVALTDDELDAVSGGRVPDLARGAQELNPYSWFVSILRLLMHKDDEEEDSAPDGLRPGFGGGVFGRK